MKVDTEDSPGQWTESLSIRIQLPLQSDNSDNDTGDEGFAVAAGPFSAPSRKGPFTRSSTTSLMALRSLLPEAPLVLFTPFLPPAGPRMSAQGGPQQHRDPFETFGRELARHHPNICHVPYVGSIGFTNMHLDFVIRSAAVITIVWEPDRAHQEEVTEHEEFAEAALDAFMADQRKGLGGAEYVLVQYPADGADARVPFECPNIIETRSYDHQAAVYVADAIFGRI